MLNKGQGDLPTDTYVKMTIKVWKHMPKAYGLHTQIAQLMYVYSKYHSKLRSEV